MTKKIVAITMTVFAVCFLQLTIVALNNDGYGEDAYDDDVKKGRSRWARDKQDEVSTCAITDAHYVKPTKKKPRKTLSWYAYGRAAYQGGENTFDSEYDCKADAKGFVDTNIGKWKGNVWKSAHMRVVIYPQPVGVDVHINDCNSHGDISTTNPTTGQTSTSRAEIPFTSQ